MNPMLSILMPVYNVAPFVKEAIESVLNQTFTDFELILLDDCSPDASADIIKTFDDARIVYHRNKKNLGLADNLNVGLKMASGKYIARADSDDICLPDRFETQVNFLEAHPDIDLCSCGLEKFGKEQDVWVRENDFDQVKITMMFYSPVLHATSVWRRESFENHDLKYDQNAFPAEDYELWSRAVFCCRLVNIPQVLYRYRIHGNQVTKTDNRTAMKNREIQDNYLRRALPSLSESARDAFIRCFIGNRPESKDDMKRMRSSYQLLLTANKKDGFFHQAKLEKRLRRYYQNALYAFLSEQPHIGFWQKIRLSVQLRYKQVFRLCFGFLLKARKAVALSK